MINTAFGHALNVHSWQKDLAGQPYIYHVLRVAMHFQHDEELFCIALLHDVIEDSPVHVKHLIKRDIEHDFPPRISIAVELLTHSPEDSYDDYIKKIGTNFDATRVKLMDLKDNRNTSRLDGKELTEKDHSRLQKYARAYDYLSYRSKQMMWY